MGAWLWEADLGHTLSPPLWPCPSALAAQAGSCVSGPPAERAALLVTEGRRAALFMLEVHSILRDLCRVPPQNTENG